MDKMLVAGFGGEIGKDVLSQLKEFGVKGIRQDIQKVDQRQFEKLALELEEVGLTPLWIVGLNQIPWLLSRSLAEYGNEPDLYTVAAKASYIDTLPLAFELAHTADIRLAAGAVSNMNERGFEYLRRMISRIPLDAPAAVHRYGDWPGPSVCHPPANTRDEEIDIFLGIIGDRKWWMTEFGYSTARQPKPWWSSGNRWYTDEDVKTYVRYEFALYEGRGAELACLFQLNDGEPENMDNRYGVRKSNGSWKIPGAIEIFKELS